MRKMAPIWFLYAQNTEECRTVQKHLLKAGGSAHCESVQADSGNIYTSFLFLCFASFCQANFRQVFAFLRFRPPFKSLYDGVLSRPPFRLRRKKGVGGISEKRYSICATILRSFFAAHLPSVSFLRRRLASPPPSSTIRVRLRPPPHLISATGRKRRSPPKKRKKGPSFLPPTDPPAAFLSLRMPRKGLSPCRLSPLPSDRLDSTRLDRPASSRRSLLFPLADRNCRSFGPRPCGKKGHH